jgi:hypothetical protein
MLQGKVIPKRNASRIPKHYLTVSRALMRSTRFSATEKLVIAYLQDMLMENNHKCWPTHDTIVAKTGVPKRTMITALNKLVGAGVIIRVPGGGHKRSTRYFLTQDLFPCRMHPENLCDRDACQEQCPWRSTNSADSAPFVPDSTENKQCEIGTLFQPNSADSAPFMPLNSAESAHKEKKTTSNKKEQAGKRICPPGAGDPEPRPPLSIETQEVGSRSGHSQVKDLLCQLYETAFGKPYLWQGQDGAILKGILKLDITLDEIKIAIENMFRDEWVVSKDLVSMKTFKSNINKYRPSTKPAAFGQGSWDDAAIEVHTRPQPGEEPLDWPWPRTGNPRNDHDIPHKAQGRGMHEFSSRLVHKLRDWIRDPGKRGSWPLTMTGTYGNGKTACAGSLLQSWRDHVTPELMSDMLTCRNLHEKRVCSLSQFVTFEDFREFCVIDTSNPNTGWVDKPVVDADYIEKLSNVDFLVLDDVCSCSADKVQLEAMHNLLRLREEKGKMTVITTNKTLAELGELLGGSVADRLTAGMVLRFVDQSRRDLDNPIPSRLPEARGLPRTMPNPSMDSGKAHIPYVEPETEECNGTSGVDHISAEIVADMSASVDETEEEDLAAAIASIDTAVVSKPTQPATANRLGMNPPRPAWGSGDESA